MSDEKQKVISVLRALIISSPQRGKSVRELIRDFCEFEGKRQVPTFEHRRIEDFLRASGQFIFENFNGELIVHEKPNSESHHISKLVAEQNKPKHRSSSSQRIQRFVRRPQINFAIRSSYPLSGTRSPSKSIFPRRFGNNVTNNQHRVEIPIHQRTKAPTIEFSFDQYSQQMANVQNPVSTNNRVSSSNSCQMSQPFDLRNRLTASRRITSSNIRASQSIPVECIDLTTDDLNSPKNTKKEYQHHDDRYSKENSSVSPTISENSMRSKHDFPKKSLAEHQNEVKQISTPSTAPIYTSNDVKQMPQPSLSAPILKSSNPFFDISNPPSKLQTSQLPSRIQDRLRNPPKYDVHAAIVNTTTSCNNDKKSTVNDRLVQARLNINSTPPLVDMTKAKESDFNRNETTTAQESLSQIRQPFQSKVPCTTSQNDQFHIDSLFRYCDDNHLGEAVFKLFKVKPNNRLQCHVTINNIRYSTYPTDYGNENEARSETAKYALERLIACNNLLKYPVCLDEEVELAIKIYKCIKDCPTGVFSKKIPEQFQTVYQQSLPVEWIHLIKNYPKLFTIDDCINDQIVYIVEEKETDEIYIEYQKMDKLKLPWEDDYWCLCITCTTSTTEVYGRIIGEEYSHSLDTLLTEIEMDLLSNKNLAKQFSVGQIYLVSITACIYRVRIEKVDNARQQCLCFFVDEGNQSWIAMKEIYICRSKFTRFPAQAIRFALYGLEDFAENDFALPHLETVLLGKSLIGHIFTKQADFIQLDESDDMEAIIQVVFYDTSTDDDINLNPVIVEKICGDIPAPNLLPSKLTPVYISHIANNGDVFCQLQRNGVHYVNKLIRKFTQYNTDEEPPALQVNGNTKKKLFLVFDEDTGTWCRGSLIQEGKGENTIFFVDYGKTKNVPLSKIYRLESLSQALLTFPPQAIKTKLYGIDDIPENLVSMLRGYFSPDTLAYMKVHVKSNVPEVKLYLIKDSLITCINDSFELEKECNQAQVIDEVSSLSFSRQISSSSNNSEHGDEIRLSSNNSKHKDEQETDEVLSSINKLSISSDKYLSTMKLPKLSKFPPPDVESYFEVDVVMASNPSNFVIRSNKHMPRWVDQMKSLQEYCKKNTNAIETNMIEVGQAYACLHSDGSWYRAIIEFHRQSKIIMYFCDLGEIDDIDDIKKLKFLPEEYRVLPKLAMTAKLFGIKPISSDWDMDDCILFNRQTVGKKFQSIVGKVTDNENCGDNSLLELTLIDVSTDVDVCINDFFIENERAIRI